MSVNAPTNWSDPWSCPFCEDDLADPGAGFMDHIEDSPDCKASFDQWRENVAGDVKAGWSG